MNDEPNNYQPHDDNTMRGALLNKALSHTLAGLTPEGKQRFIRIWEFRRLMESESDRGAALMAGAFLDDQLADLLKATLRLNSELRTKLFDYTGPLGSLSSRINMAYAIGLIPANVRSELKRVRDIRNVFAHNSEPMTFAHAKVEKLVMALVLRHKIEVPYIRARFVQSVSTLTSYLEGLCGVAKPIEAPPDFDIEAKRAAIGPKLDRLSQFLKGDGPRE